MSNIATINFLSQKREEGRDRKLCKNFHTSMDDRDSIEMSSSSIFKVQACQSLAPKVHNPFPPPLFEIAQCLKFVLNEISYFLTTFYMERTINCKHIIFSTLKQS